MWREGHLPKEPPVEEVIFWLWTCGLLSIEFQQVTRLGNNKYQTTRSFWDYFDYFTYPRQCTDFFSFSTVLVVASVRVAIWSDTYLPEDEVSQRAVQLRCGYVYAITSVVFFLRFTAVLVARRRPQTPPNQTIA